MTKKHKVVISRKYEVDIDMNNPKEVDVDYIKLQALSSFNRDLQFGLISANMDDFSCEIKYDWVE